MAGDQIEIQLPKTQYNERTSFTATAYFRTRATGAAATPTTVHYRIDNLSTQLQVLDWTSVTPATTASITVKGAENVISVNSRSVYGATPTWQRMALTVAIDKDLDTQVTQTKTWKVNNIFGVS
mgnify:CR=1 FL=1